jgi:hypothetical protein
VLHCGRRCHCFPAIQCLIENQATSLKYVLSDVSPSQWVSSILHFFGEKSLGAPCIRSDYFLHCLGLWLGRNRNANLANLTCGY